jgi:hypothetical protein
VTVTPRNQVIRHKTASDKPEVVADVKNVAVNPCSGAGEAFY